MQRQLINRGKKAVYVQDHAQLKQLYAETRYIFATVLLRLST